MSTSAKTLPLILWILLLHNVRFSPFFPLCVLLLDISKMCWHFTIVAWMLMCMVFCVNEFVYMNYSDIAKYSCIKWTNLRLPLQMATDVMFPNLHTPRLVTALCVNNLSAWYKCVIQLSKHTARVSSPQMLHDLTATSSWTAGNNCMRTAKLSVHCSVIR